MAEVAGVTNAIYILTGATHMTGSTGAVIHGISKSTYAQACDIMEITAFGDTYKRRVAGLKDFTLNIEGYLYTGDTTGQDELVIGDSVWIGLYPSGTAVAGTQMPAIIESVETSADVQGYQTIKAVALCNGVPEELPVRA